MLTTRQKVFRKFWHATVPLSTLQGEAPQPFTLLGENIVLFLDAQGQPAALLDRCCHRTAKLSKGRCIAGRLQCGYHGWTYDGAGRVVRIPQYEEGRAIPADYCTPAFRCVARYGYAWVALEEPIAPIPDMPEFGAPGWRTIFQFDERWATSPLRALENSFDNSHFSFVHRATFGVADQPKPSRYRIVENDTGFYAETVIDAANPPAFHRVSGSSEPLTQRHMRNAYYLPFSRRLDIEYPSANGKPGVRHVILNCFTPIDDGHMQLVQWLFRNDTEADCPEAMLIEFDHAITREDKDILESTDPDALVDTRRRGVEYSMDSDRPGMLIRKKLMELLARHGEAEVHRGSGIIVEATRFDACPRPRNRLLARASTPSRKAPLRCARPAPDRGWQLPMCFAAQADGRTAKASEPAATRQRAGAPLVDSMLGSAKLRRPKAGADPLFDALHERFVAGAEPARPAKAAARGDYGRLLKAIEAASAGMAGRAAAVVNQALVLRNWIVGATIVEYEQSGKDRAQYGARLLERLAEDLAARGLSGLGLSRLRSCRLLFQAYPQIRQTLSGEFGAGRLLPQAIRQTVSDELPVGPSGITPLPPEQLLRLSWSHLHELLAVDDALKRAFYENECLAGGWSVRQLQRQIESLLYERTGLSRDKRAVIDRARSQAAAAPSPSVAELIRDPYVLEFTGLAERAVWSESDLETALLDHLQRFLLELGTGFCFEARQFRMTVANKHDRVDLVFYHRTLRCHVLVDLKIRAFRHADAGQMNFYLNWFKAHMQGEGDNPPVGIVLASAKDRTEVEFATAGMDNQLFVSRYLVALPTAEQLRALIDADRALFAQTQAQPRKKN